MGEEVQDAGHVSCLSPIHHPLPTTRVARSLIGPFDDTLNRLVTLISHCGARLHSRFFHFLAATWFTDFRLLATAQDSDKVRQAPKDDIGVTLTLRRSLNGSFLDLSNGDLYAHITP